MEFLNGGELFNCLRKEKRFSEEKTAFYAAEITLALECLHSHDIIYRDLKPENIVIASDGHVKLTDFGLSKEGMGIHAAKATSIAGTADYLAPEIIRDIGHERTVDWWTLGVLIYEMLTGWTPFYSRDRHQIFRNIVEKEPEMKPYFSDNVKSLLSGLLCKKV
jgi:serine/threonine protein kinase